ncbi:MAG: hypothetical protein AMXMBFR56_14620 [Polyangiaceae bacterium]
MRTPKLAVCLAFLAVSACNQKDPKKCENAQSVIRQGIVAEDFAAARQWRDYAYKHCADRTALDALDKDIVDKEAAVQSRKAAEDQKRQQTEQLVKLFSEWAGTHKSNPAGAAVNVACSAPADPKKEKERWCTRERAASEHKLRVTYWEAEPDVFEFSTLSPGEVSCELLGGGTALKNAHGGALLHCDLTGGVLAGTQALMVRTAQGTVLSVFSPKYAEKNEAFRRRLNM